MATIPVPIYSQMGSAYADQIANIWYEVFDASGVVKIGRTQNGLVERGDYNGDPAGVYKATIQVDMSWAYPLTIEWTIEGSDGEGILAVDTVGWEFALLQTAGVGLNLNQALTDTKAQTVGGALSGAWSTAWGKIVKDLVNKTLGVFGPGNASGTPSETFQLDNMTNPTERVPQ